jgi:antirestriction protein
MIRLGGWVGCWACYNEGFQVGDWFDLADGVPTIAEVHRRGMDRSDRRSGVTEHEELGAFDLDGDLAWFAKSIGESLVTAVAVAEVIADIDADRLAPFAAYAEENSEPVNAALRDQFEDTFIGEFESARDFGIDYCAELIGWDSLPHEIQEALAPVLDWEAFGQNYLDGDYGYARVDQTLYVWQIE